MPINTKAPRTPLAIHFEVYADFIKGNGTLKTLAAKHNVPYRTVRDWCFKENWSKERREFFERSQQHRSAGPDASEAEGAGVGQAAAKPIPSTEELFQRIHTLFPDVKTPKEALMLAKCRTILQELLFLEQHGYYPARQRARRETYLSRVLGGGS